MNIIQKYSWNVLDASTSLILRFVYIIFERL